MAMAMATLALGRGKRAMGASKSLEIKTSLQSVPAGGGSGGGRQTNDDLAWSVFRSDSTLP